MNLGNRICTLRKEKNMTQQQLAEMLFVTDKTVSSWESNRTEPSLETIINLSEIFDCDISYLINGSINKNNIETEIKIQLTKKEFDDLNILMEKEAKFIRENCQNDTYYQPIHKPFLNDVKIKEWLRIGKRGNKKIINYKNWYDDYCDEYEVEIDDDDNLRKIFKALGLESIAVVDKVRKIYLYLNKYEVALDEVKDLGYFVEIEVKKYDNEITQEYSDLLKLAKNLGLDLNNIRKQGYPYYLIYKNN